MSTQTVKIVDGDMAVVDYDGPITRYKARYGAEDVKVTIWIPLADLKTAKNAARRK